MMSLEISATFEAMLESLSAKSCRIEGKTP
jgi:hypothetical protein